MVQVNVVGTRASKKTVEKESERISLPYLTRTIENRWKFLALLPLHGYIVAFHCLAASVDRCSCLDESVKMLGPLLSLSVPPPRGARGKSSDMEMRDLFKNVRWFGKFRVFFVTRFAPTQ